MIKWLKNDIFTKKTLHIFIKYVFLEYSQGTIYYGRFPKNKEFSCYSSLKIFPIKLYNIKYERCASFKQEDRARVVLRRLPGRALELRVITWTYINVVYVLVLSLIIGGTDIRELKPYVHSGNI